MWLENQGWIFKTIAASATCTANFDIDCADMDEALESDMCDVINIRLKRRLATRSGKGNQQLYIKTAIERPILRLGYPNVMWNFYLILLLVASILFRRIFMTSHMTLSRALHGSF